MLWDLGMQLPQRCSPLGAWHVTQLQWYTLWTCCPFRLMVNHGRFMAHFGARTAFLQGIEGRLSRTYLWKWMSSPFFLDFSQHFHIFHHMFHIFHHIFPIFFHGGSPLFPLLQSPGPRCSKVLGKVGNQLVMTVMCLLNFNHNILEIFWHYSL